MHACYMLKEGRKRQKNSEKAEKFSLFRHVSGRKGGRVGRTEKTENMEEGRGGMEAGGRAWPGPSGPWGRPPGQGRKESLPPLCLPATWPLKRTVASESDMAWRDRQMGISAQKIHRSQINK